MPIFESEKVLALIFARGLYRTVYDKPVYEEPNSQKRQRHTFIAATTDAIKKVETFREN